jgi:hypothetical protein
VEKPGGTLFQLQALKRDPHAALTKKKSHKVLRGLPEINFLGSPSMTLSLFNQYIPNEKCRKHEVLTAFDFEPCFKTVVTARHPQGAVTMFDSEYQQAALFSF